MRFFSLIQFADAVALLSIFGLRQIVIDFRQNVVIILISRLLLRRCPLSLDQFIVSRFLLDEFIVGALLDNTPVRHHHNIIRILNSRESVSNDHGSSSLSSFVECSL